MNRMTTVLEWILRVIETFCVYSKCKSVLNGVNIFEKAKSV